MNLETFLGSSLVLGYKYGTHLLTSGPTPRLFGTDFIIKSGSPVLSGPGPGEGMMGVPGGGPPPYTGELCG